MAEWVGGFLKSQKERVQALMKAGILRENSVNQAYRVAMEFYIQECLKSHRLEKEAIDKADNKD